MGVDISKIRIELTGRLGNQLFVYFAGLSRSHVDGSELSLLANNVETLAITSFRLKAKVRTRTFIESIISRLLDFSELMTGSTALKNLVIHKAVDEGPDWRFLSKRGPRYWRGYFQDATYFDSLPKELRTLELRSEPSEEYLVLKKKFMLAPPIVVHIRRGDFLLRSNRETYGLLSLDYFRSGLAMALKSQPNAEIWVSSDDASAAAHFCREIRGHSFPPTLSAPEALMLMSMGAAFVISNSSFAYWAARLSNSQSVYRPSPWFRGSTSFDPCPDSWHSVLSSWEAET